MKIKHLALYISGHGYGHLAQCIPVVKALQTYPHQLSVFSSLPEALLRQRLGVVFEYYPAHWDFGMKMCNSLDVDLAASLSAYEEFARHWPDQLAQVGRWLKNLRVDCLLSNVAYLPLAAARQQGIPAYAFSSLNWWHVLQPFLPADYIDTCGVLEQMQSAYGQANGFFATRPAMPMPGLDNLIEVDALDIRALAVEPSLRQHLQVSAQQSLLLVGFGGIEQPLEVAQWNLPAHISCLVNHASHASDKLININILPFDFMQLLASVNVVISKPGYGTAVQCVLQQVPALFVKRDDWAEEQSIVNWLQAHGRVGFISRQQLQQGDFMTDLQHVMSLPVKKPPACNGAEQILRQLFA